MLPRRLAALLVAVAFVAGCGGDDSGDSGGSAPRTATTEEQSVGPRVAGSVVQYADCEDWRRGTRAEREVTVRELRDQLTQQGERSTESPLSDERAYAILQKTCRSEISASLRLYKIYARVQGFAPLAE